jgi:hypothetical protein
MMRLIRLMLSEGSKVAFIPPISVRTQPGLMTTHVMPRGVRSMAYKIALEHIGARHER